MTKFPLVLVNLCYDWVDTCVGRRTGLSVEEGGLNGMTWESSGDASGDDGSSVAIVAFWFCSYQVHGQQLLNRNKKDV